MIIVANWKNNKNKQEVLDWCEEFSELLQENTIIEVVVCPPYPFIRLVTKHCPSTVKLGAQNISHFSNQTCTGEVGAETLKGLVDYVIVGHSERHSLLDETRQDVQTKLEIAQQAGIIPIVCFREIADLEPLPLSNNAILAYESPKNISGGGDYNPADPKEVANIFAEVKNIYPEHKIIYGGSVTPQTAKSFIDAGADGLLVGQASLSAKTFTNLVKALL